MRAEGWLRPFGNTGLVVPALGLGAGGIGDPAMSETEVARLLHHALDTGVTLIDTARAYGISEERIGRALAGRRDRFVLSTKVGYGVPGHADWTGACIAAGVDAALLRLGTDWIDIVHLHSCPLEALRRDDVLHALEAAVRAGKVRVAAYSGENEALRFAIASGCFKGVQASVNLCDQAAAGAALPAARAAGIGVIGKRALANAPWRFATEPARPDLAEYWRRFTALALDRGGLAWEELAIRFAGHRPGVDTILLGTASVEHLDRGRQAIERGALPAEVERALEAAFRRQGAGWPGLV